MSALRRLTELQDSFDHLGLDSSAVPSPTLDHHELSWLLASLVAFLDEHRYCGELDGGAED